jgi:bacillolysin
MKNRVGLVFSSIILIFFSFTIAYGGPNEVLLDLAKSKKENLLKGRTGSVRFLAGEDGKPIAQPTPPPFSDPEFVARHFLKANKNLFGVNDPETDLVLRSKKTTENKRTIIKLEQVYKHLPVYGAELVIQVDQSNQVLMVSGDTSNASDIDVVPSLPAETAIEQALVFVGEEYNVKIENLKASVPELWIFNPAMGGYGKNENILVWRSEVTATNGSLISEVVLVDANNGSIVHHVTQIYEAKSRSVYNNKNTYSGLPGLGPVRTEWMHAATWITDVDQTFAYLGDTYDFYMYYHGRDSVDGLGMPITATALHCDQRVAGCPMRGAFWDYAAKQMAIGQGFAVDDVIAHEYTHGVTRAESRLEYANQPGAINESFSDIWGEFVDLTNFSGDDSSLVRWKIGEDLPNGAIRDMKNPTIGKMTDYNCTTFEWGNVHSNSGINNKVAYLLVDGGLFNGIRIMKIGMIKTAQIYYEAQTNILSQFSDYSVLYRALPNACRQLFGHGAAECTQVTKAVEAVEMYLAPCYYPDVKANGSNGPISVSSSSSVNVTISLTKGAQQQSTNADLWVKAHHNGIWYYVDPSGTLTTTAVPYRQGTYSTLNNLSVWNSTLPVPPGSTVTIYFAIDLAMNGVFDIPYRQDYVIVNTY